MLKKLFIVLLLASQSVIAHTHTEWVLSDHQPRQSDKIKPSASWSFGAMANIGFAHGNLRNTQKSEGHYGFGVTLAQHFSLSPKFHLGYEIALNTQDKTNFVDHQGNLIFTRLWDIGVLATYDYSLHPRFSIGGATGLAWVWGNLNNHPSVRFFSRFEPVLGLQLQYRLTHQLSLTAGYRHYFGVAASQAYQARQAAPSIDRFSLGVRYAF